VGAGLAFIVVKVFGDLIMLIGYYNGWLAYPPAYIAAHPEGNWQVGFSDVLGGIFQVASLFIFMGIMFIPAVVRTHTDRMRGVDKHVHRNY
jgi:ABC-type phosphate transport system permease subunit